MNTIPENKIAAEEPMTKLDIRRFALYPIKKTNIWNMFKKAFGKFWTFDEIDWSSDYASFVTLNSDEQKYISHILAFFANSDNIVMENLRERFCKEIQYPEARAFFDFQTMIENVHVVVYNDAINTLIKDEKEKEKLFLSIQNNPIVQPKLQWAMQWISSDASLAERLVAWAAVEGIFFSSSFAAIFRLRKMNKTPGLTFSNEKIVEDECLHVLFSVLLYREEILNKLPIEKVHKIIDDAVKIEHQFLSEALPVSLIGLDETMMKQYVCRVADTILELLDVPKLYNVLNPFEWMENFGVNGKSNFFEKRVSEYAIGGKETKISEPISDLGESC